MFSFLSLTISRRKIISGSAQPIFAIFSPNEIVLGVDDRSGPFFDISRYVAMATDFVKRKRQTPHFRHSGMWWCYRASVCAIGVISLALSDSPLFSLIKPANSQITNHQPIIASDRRSRRLNRKTTALHTAVQGFINKVDLAYQPDGRLAVDAYAD